MPKISLTDAKDAVDKFLSHAATEYDRFKSDRDSAEIDEKAEVADAMLRCFRNRDIAAIEQREASGRPESEDAVASVGSVRFFRLVNQKNAQLDAAVHASEVPVTYKPIANPEVFHSAQEGADQAAVHNVLARYAWKQDRVAEKLYEEGVQLFSRGYWAWQIVWNSERKRVKVYDPEKKKSVWKEVTVRAYPSCIPLGYDSIYADLHGGPIDNQQTVVILTMTSWPKIQQAVKMKWFDAEAVAEIEKERGKYRWSGAEGSDMIEAQAENDGRPLPNIGESDIVLQWDVYSYVPIKGSEWSDENPYELHWMTVLGNTLSSSAGKVVRLENDFDPDGEIPVFVGNVLPDSRDRLYHRTYAEVVRPLYSMECTLWDQTFDNNHAVNHPRVAFDSQQLNTKPEDFTFSVAAKVDIRNPRESLAEFATKSTLGENISLIGQLQQQQEMAFASNQNQMGQGFGGRMAATENINISRQSQMPNIAELRYSLGKFLHWWGKKDASYWQGYAPESLVKLIADEGLKHPTYIGKLKEGEKFPEGTPIYGHFDIELTVLDEFMDDFVQASQELALIQTVSTNQGLAQSKTHRVDFGFWLRDFMRRRRVRNADRIVLPMGESDAHLRQREEIERMHKTGEMVPIQEGEDHAAHIAEIDAKILELSPLLTIDPAELDAGQQAARNYADALVTQLLKPHRAMHEAALSQQVGAMQQGATPAAPPGGETPGMAAGGVPAAELGAALGG
jgi:hypothetical protein